MASILTETGSGPGLEPAARYIAGFWLEQDQELDWNQQLDIWLAFWLEQAQELEPTESVTQGAWVRFGAGTSPDAALWSLTGTGSGTSKNQELSVHSMDGKLVCCSINWCINKYIDTISSSLYIIFNHIMDTWDPTYDYRILIYLHGRLIIILSSWTGSYLSLEDPDYSPLEVH